MASIENEHLVVNVVYTGPPLAGKTQSVKALMPQLKGRGADRQVFSPGDWRGRTAFFDWAEYEGGAFEGKSIQCRIISTPGQVALSDRREMILRSADAVIMVIDSRAEALERAVQCYEEMAPWLAEASREVPLRVVLQCNKQDLPGSLTPEDLMRRLPVPCGKDLFATSASTGKGLRAAFVAGVRNAVDRARELVARGLLEAPELSTGQELFERMQRETAPIGSLHPSSPAAASSPSPASETEQPAADAAAPARTARSKSESARPSARASSRAAAASSAGSGRPPASKEPAAAGAGPFPFGTGKSKSSSGLYPSLSARSSTPPPRSGASKPALPPDHPFASNPPTKPSTRRPSSSSSRRTPSTRTSASSTSAGRSVPRAKAGENAPATSGDEPARSRASQHSASGATARRGAATNDSSTTGTRMRPNRTGGAKSPALPADVLTASSSSDGAATATPGLYGDTGQRLAAAAARAAAEAAAARLTPRLESHSSIATSALAPALDAPGSSPPSSATAPVPASSTRRALVPPYSEPRSLPEPVVVPPVGPHPEGWLDPAGAAARAWRPGEGTRPAVMPASAYRALVPAELEAPREPLAPDDVTPADAARAAGAAGADARSGVAHESEKRSPEPPAQPAPPRATAQTFAAGGPRPAVMPVNAYLAILAQRQAPSEARTDAASAPTPPAPAPAEARAKGPAAQAPAKSDGRPAALPARAWLALEMSETSPGRAPLAPASSPSPPSSAAPGGGEEDPVDSGWPDAGEVLSLPPPFATPAPRQRMKTRPAVIPADVWRSLVEQGELPRDAERGPSNEPSERASASTPLAPTPPAASSDEGGLAADGGDADDEWPRSPGAARSASRSLRLLRGGTPGSRDDGRTPTRPALTLLERPAVVPASAWRAVFDTTAVEGAANGAAAPDSGAAANGAGHPERSLDDTPTITPSAPHELLATERQTLAPNAPAPPEAGAAPPGPVPEVGDSAALGHEPSPLLVSGAGPAEESSESFRIPETPPGLQAFVAKARLSAPPPPVPAANDDVIQSLPPSLEEGLEGAVSNGAETPPVEFSGPRMPGHVRAPRAVWRRSIWRTLETHITSDATALEDARGRWIGELAPGWYARTLRSASDERSARRAFAEEVLRERRLGQYLSRPRCVALTEEADRFWIWQAACRVPTLSAVLGRRLAARESASAMAEALLDASLAFIEARQRFIKAQVPLPLSLHALSVQDDKLVYSGLLPDPGAVFVHPPNDGHLAFEDALRKKWPGAHVDGAAVFAELSGKAAGRLPEPILEIIRSVAGQSSMESSTHEVSG